MGVEVVQVMYLEGRDGRDGARSKNLGWQVVMQRGDAAWRRLLFCQNLGGRMPPLPPPPLPPTLERIDENHSILPPSP